MKPYTVEYWYRHESDADQSIRAQAQMSAGADSEADVHAECSRMRAQGYSMQKAIMRLDCTTCNGTGQITVRPKGMRRKVAATAPYWRLGHRSCAVCRGDGWTDAAEISVT